MKHLLKFSGFLAVLVGIVLLAGGAWGINFTCKNVIQEKIVTPEDASMPNTPVKGPLSLWAQAEIIREHTLKTTGGKTFAEMPRQIQKTDEKGNLVVDKDGKPVMMDNAARNIWITATTLITALNLAILAYVFSGLSILLGIMFIWDGILLLSMKKYMPLS